MTGHLSAMKLRTKEPQYAAAMRIANQHPLQTFGLMSNQAWFDDPKRIGFTLARYKFVAKMFSGMKNVLEVGCADAFATRVVLQEVKSLAACDFDPVFVEDVNRRMSPRWKFECFVHDMLSGSVDRGFDGAYALDVIEHIPKTDEHKFLKNMVKSLGPAGVCILGSPSIQSQTYASPPSKEGHVNCKDAAGLKLLMAKHFHNVFIFSMNDEVLHTGFYAMAHYLFALGCCPKSQ
jgi:2-polyprenyl-3-methyl-5-hydroxy-6-metoxy-1,4-benzoquinol methylase